MVALGEAVEIRSDVGTLAEVGIDRLQSAAELEELRHECLPDTAPVFVVQVEERAVRHVETVAHPVGQRGAMGEVAGADAEGVGACRRHLGRG